MENYPELDRLGDEIAELSAHLDGSCAAGGVSTGARRSRKRAARTAPVCSTCIRTRTVRSPSAGA